MTMCGEDVDMMIGDSKDDLLQLIKVTKPLPVDEHTTVKVQCILSVENMFPTPFA